MKRKDADGDKARMDTRVHFGHSSLLLLLLLPSRLLAIGHTQIGRLLGGNHLITITAAAADDDDDETQSTIQPNQRRNISSKYIA